MHNQIPDHRYLDSEGYEIPLPYTDPHDGPLDPQATSFAPQINENFPPTILEPPEPPAPLATITLRSHTRSEYDLPSRHTLDFYNSAPSRRQGVYLSQETFNWTEPQKLQPPLQPEESHSTH